MSDFTPLNIPDVKLCAGCQAATDAANPFPKGPGVTHAFYNEDGVFGFTFEPYSRPTA